MLVDDQVLARRGLGLVLAEQSDVEVVGETDSGHEAVSMAMTLRPDIVLTEAKLPDLDGIEITRSLACHPQTACPKVVIVTSFDSDEYLIGALQAGARGFMLKNTPAAEVVAAIRAVAGGGAVICPSMTQRLIDRFRSRPALGAGAEERLLDTLSGREFEVLGYLSIGKTNREIAKAMGLTTATVKCHVSSVLAKLQLRDRVQAALVGYEAGVASRAPASDGHAPRSPTLI